VKLQSKKCGQGEVTPQCGPSQWFCCGEKKIKSANYS